VTKNKIKLQQPNEVPPINDSGIIVDDVNKFPSKDDETHGSGEISGEDGWAITAKLSQLSPDAGTQGIYEVHGVADFTEETPEMIRSKLGEVSKVADSFGVNKRAEAYRKVLQINKEYVEGIKLLSLRANNYDCKQAASYLFHTFR
jgi:hypothetical protein